MARRQRLLIGAAAVAALLLLTQGAWNVFIARPLAQQQSAVKSAEAKAEKTQSKLIEARWAKLKLEEIEPASLPLQPNLAQDHYQGYLVSLLQTAHVNNSTLSPGQPVEREGVTVVPFTVSAETTLDRLLLLLHSFHSTPRLQRITRLSLNPVERPDMGAAIRFSLSVEALGFAESDEDKGEKTLAREVAAAWSGTPKTTRNDIAALTERNLLFPRAPGGSHLTGNSPDHVVLTSIVHDRGRAEADVYDRGLDQSRRVNVGESWSIGSTHVRLLDLGLRDAVIEIAGDLFLWPLGQTLSNRLPLTAEAALDREIFKNKNPIALSPTDSR